MPADRDVPVAAPGRGDTPSIKGIGYLAQCCCSGPLSVLDHRQHVGRVGVSSRLHGTYGNFACLGELGLPSRTPRSSSPNCPRQNTMPTNGKPRWKRYCWSRN